MAKSANYWKERMKALEDEQYVKTTEYYNDLQKQFRMAQNNLQIDIEYWYRRLAENNDISLTAAKKLLNKDELEEFHWTVEEYIKRGEENAVNPRWMRKLENASAKVHINRLEAMKLQVQQHAEILYQNYEHGTTEFLSGIYEDTYYHTAYEIAKGTSISSSFSRIDTNKIDKVIKTPWGQDGKVFSDRIWENKDKLVRELHTELTQCLIRGENPDEAAKRLAEKMGTKLTSARTLVYTESTAISASAQKDCFSELQIEEFEIVETLDSHTCGICGEMDGRHFPMKDFQIGITAPPFHPRCRGCTCPYFDDEFTNGKRIARGDDGKQYYVPENMTYTEWKETFTKDVQTVSAPNFKDDNIKRAYDEFGKMLLTSDGTDMLVNNMIIYSETTEFVIDKKLKAPFAYRTNSDKIAYNPKAPNYELYDLNYVQSHELAHRMDFKEYHSWDDKRLALAIEISRSKVYDNINEVISWFGDGGEYEFEYALSDIISALTKGKINQYLPATHAEEYWGIEHMESMEIFANLCSIDVNGYACKEVFKNIFRELWDEYRRMVL